MNSNAHTKAHWSRRGNLPAESTSFVGRRLELAVARRALESTRLVTLTGPGGVGKTQLALRVAGRVRRAFPDGVWLVELAALEDQDLLTQVIADVLELRDHSGRSPLAMTMDHLQDKRCLVLLDNCEHLIEACGPIVAKLLAAAGGLRVLATSRQVLRVEGEHILPVHPLPVPDPTHLPPNLNVHSYEGVRLFAERAASVAQGFEVNADNRAAVVGICHRLDGIPLAVELAAARLRVLSPEEILRRLDDRFGLLVGGSRAALPRHQTLQAAVDWSFELCTPEERALWARASVFAGGLDLDAVEVVCSGGGIDRRQVFELVTGLVDKSILTRGDLALPGRYRMLDTIRHYGWDRLCEAGADAESRRRHRDYYLDLAERGDAAWFGSGQVESFTRTCREHADLRVALEYSLSTPDEAPTGLRLATALSYYWIGCGVVTEGRRWLHRALSLDCGLTALRAKALFINACLAFMQADYRAGADAVDRCRALAQQCGEQTALAYATFAQGVGALVGGDHEAADVFYRESTVRFATLSEVPWIVNQIHLFEMYNAVWSGDHLRANELARRVRAICESHGERWALANACSTLAWAEFHQHELEQATGHAKEALRITRAFNDLVNMAYNVDLLSWIAAATGDSERAATLLGVVRQLWVLSGGRTQMPIQSWKVASREACERTARESLGDRAFDIAFARGSELDLDEAMTIALGESPRPADSTPVTTEMGERSLTRRERQVAELVAEGLTNKQIGDRLVIAPRTAEGHVERIRTKLGFSTRSQVAAWVTEQRRARGV